MLGSAGVAVCFGTSYRICERGGREVWEYVSGKGCLGKVRGSNGDGSDGDVSIDSNTLSQDELAPYKNNSWCR